MARYRQLVSTENSRGTKRGCWAMRVVAGALMVSAALAGCAGSGTSSATDDPVPATPSAASPSAAPVPSDTASPRTSASTDAGSGAKNIRPVDSRGPFPVIRVADGDTFTVRIGATQERVRVVGIDTPESVDPRRPVQCFGVEASNRAKQLLTGQQVWLERDKTQDERDRYGRLLAFVWINDDTDFGLKMISEGYALEYTYRLPYKYQFQYQAAQVNAKRQQLGLWSPTTCNGRVS